MGLWVTRRTTRDTGRFAQKYPGYDLSPLEKALGRVRLALSPEPQDPDAPVVRAFGNLPAVFWGTGCVRLKPGKRPDILTAVGIRILKQLHFAPDLFYVKARNLGALQAAREQIADDVVYFEIEGTFTAPPRGPQSTDDPLVAEQPYLESMGIRRAWERSRGEGVTIGIVDAEFDARSSELGPNWAWSHSAYLTTDRNEGPVFRTSTGLHEYPRFEFDDHGTRCAALAAAARNGLNGVGVAPESGILALATGTLSSPMMAARALAYCADPGVEHDGQRRPGCSVIACSMTDTLTHEPSRVVDDALAFLYERGVLLISPVSNRQTLVEEDLVSTHPCAIATASVNANGERLKTGARGPGLDCVAETLGISGTSASDEWEALGPGNSWSAPVVAGVVALLRAAYPAEDASSIRARLLDTCFALGDPNETGRGLVQADRAIGL